MDEDKIEELLKRTSLNFPFDDFLHKVKSQFPSLGNIVMCQSITEGYEDANFLLRTSNGKFVLKIFSIGRSLENIQSYVKVLNECKNINVQTTEILTDLNGGLGIVENENTKIYFIITKFFEGKNFQNITPTIQDIKIVTEHLAKLNTLSFNVVESYDSWGNKNFAKEYLKNISKINPDGKSVIEPIYDDFIKLDFSIVQ